MIKDYLKLVPFFAKLDKSEIDIIENYFTLQVIEEDEILISKDEITDELFILLKGRITSKLNLPGKIERKHREYIGSDLIGEISFFGNKPSIDTIMASEKSYLLTVKKDKFQELMENHAHFSIKLISELMCRSIRQLQKTSKFLADVVQWGENASRRVITDELTGVYNRAFLDDALENFFEISKQNNKSLSFFMLDVDNFREINQHLGPEKADQVLLKVVDLIKSIISKHGIIARYGGDEFSILLPEADLIKAQEVAEEIRKSVEDQNFAEILGSSDIAVTASIGISCYPETATSIDTFKEKADSSLYRAKETGRNCVIFIP